ncbi:MAG: hypothetical protein IT436_14345 [Phycisphaerales bacterium]|nr:hypothetical protein [Phycisphaerales bacterium]
MQHATGADPIPRLFSALLDSGLAAALEHAGLSLHTLSGLLCPQPLPPHARFAAIQSALLNLARFRAVHTLQHIAATSEDPIEQRRAASAILRATAPSRAAPPDAQCLMPIASSSPRPAPPAPQPPPQPELPDTATAEEVSDYLIDTLGEEDAFEDSRAQDAILEKLHPLFAPHATLDGAPIPGDHRAFVRSVSSRQRADLFNFPFAQTSEESSTPTRHTFRTCFIRPDTNHDSFRRITLTRARPDAPWRILNIRPYPPPTSIHSPLIPPDPFPDPPQLPGDHEPPPMAEARAGPEPGQPASTGGARPP